MKRLLLALVVPLLLGACAGVTPAPTTTGTPPAVPALNLLLAKDVAQGACFQLAGDKGVATKVDTACSLLNGGLGAVENALLAQETDPRRRLYLGLVIDVATVSTSLPGLTSPIDPNSAAGQYITAACTGCRNGLALGSPTVQAVRAEALSAPAPTLSNWLAAAGFSATIGKGSSWFDVTLPLSQRLVKGVVDLSQPAGNYPRVGLDPAAVKGPMVGPEGVSQVPCQYWLDHQTTVPGIPAGYQCTAADLFDVEYIAGGLNNFWQDQIMAFWLARPGATPPPPVAPPPPPSSCLSGLCLPECPLNCTPPPKSPAPPPPPVVPGCPVCKSCPTYLPLAIPPNIAGYLADLAAGKRVNWLNQAKVAKFFAAHPGLLEAGK
jgi:hypothetical protein